MTYGAHLGASREILRNADAPSPLHPGQRRRRATQLMHPPPHGSETRAGHSAAQPGDDTAAINGHAPGANPARLINSQPARQTTDKGAPVTVATCVVLRNWRYMCQERRAPHTPPGAARQVCVRVELNAAQRASNLSQLALIRAAPHANTGLCTRSRLPVRGTNTPAALWCVVN